MVGLMSNYKRMNMIAIPVAIVLLFLMFYVGAAYRLFNNSLWRGLGCIGVSAFAGYMLGCLIGLLVNLNLHVSGKNKVIRIILLVLIGWFSLVLVWEVYKELFDLYF